MTDFPEYGTEEDKNRWAAELIEQWEGQRLCDLCGNRMEEVDTNHWLCPECDSDLYMCYGSDEEDSES